jgi:hypothetical protein
MLISNRYGTFHGSDEVPILAGVAGQRAYQVSSPSFSHSLHLSLAASLPLLLACAPVLSSPNHIEATAQAPPNPKPSALDPRPSLSLQTATRNSTLPLSLQRKLFRRRCAWAGGVTIGFVLLLLVTIAAFHYTLHRGASGPGDSAHGGDRGALHMQGIGIMPGADQSISGAVPSDMKALMNEDTNPCDDFYSYACGGFMRDTQLKADQLGFAHAWDGVQHNNTLR